MLLISYIILLSLFVAVLSLCRNCPCVPMRERHECHCMLFLTEDNAFVGEETKITYDEVIQFSGEMAT